MTFNACLFLDGTPEVGQVLTDGTVTVEVTSVDWKLDGSAVYGFSIKQLSGPRVTVTVYDSDGRSFTYNRHNDLDTFVGDDGTHHPIGGAVFCYDVPNVTTTTTIPPTTVPPTTVPATTVPPATTAPPTTFWGYPECEPGLHKDWSQYPEHCPLPVTVPPTTAPEVQGTVVEPSFEDAPVAEVVEPPDHGMQELPYTGSEHALLGAGAGGLVLLGAALVAWARRWRL